MNLRSVAVGLSALVLFSAGAQARSLFDIVRVPLEHELHINTYSPEDPISLYSAKQQEPTFDACADRFPDGKPFDLERISAKLKPMALCSDNFAVLYSQATKTPLVVVERLNAAVLRDAKGEERTNAFYPDPRIPKSGRAELSDYHGQAQTDRGHQAPAADSPSPKAMAQSFALSNMVPQNSFNNRKIWSVVENDVRKFTLRAGGDVFVFTGPIFDDGHTTIGANKVWVPTRLFKLVYDATSRRAWAYILPNAETRIERPVDYETFVNTTGLHLLGNLPVTGSISRS
jgi:endonuclease G